MILGMTWYEIAWYFILYAFLGWVTEVAYHAVAVGKVINRGFLNGPVCPVYGFSALLVFMMLHLLPGGSMENTDGLIVYVGGAILVTCVEFLAGWILDLAFHARWWDYSDKPFNLHGYICLEFSLIWGFVVLIVVKVIQPTLQNAVVERIPTKFGWPILAIFYLTLLIDFGVSIAQAHGLNKRLKELDEIQARLRKSSDKMSQVIGENTMKAAAAWEEGRLQAHLAKAEMKDAVAASRENLENRKKEFSRAQQEMTAEYRKELEKRAEAIKNALSGKGFFAGGRILRSFPEMKSRDYGAVLEELKKRLTGKREE